jgi:hypothetical protein
MTELLLSLYNAVQNESSEAWEGRSDGTVALPTCRFTHYLRPPAPFFPASTLLPLCDRISAFFISPTRPNHTHSGSSILSGRELHGSECGSTSFNWTRLSRVGTISSLVDVAEFGISNIPNSIS